MSTEYRQHVLAFTLYTNFCGRSLSMLLHVHNFASDDKKKICSFELLFMIFVPVLYSLYLTRFLSLSCVVFFQIILSQFSSPVCNKNEEKIEASQSARIRLNKTNKVIAKCACFSSCFFPDPCYNFVFCICNSVVHAPVSEAAFCSIFCFGVENRI